MRISSIRPSSSAARLAAQARELAGETAAGALFIAVAMGLAATAPPARASGPLLACALVTLYALASRSVRVRLGSGHVTSSYLVLVPMLLLLPAQLAPLLVAGGLALGVGAEVLIGRERSERVMPSVAEGWHSLRPAIVLATSPAVHGVALAGVYLAAFAAGCLLDALASALRRRARLGVTVRPAPRVIASVWAADASLAALGLLIAHAAAKDSAQLLLALPSVVLVGLLSRDRGSGEQARRRLDVLARERERLQKAVRCLGDAFAAKLDLSALADILLRGSIEALDADGGRFTLNGAVAPVQTEVAQHPHMARALNSAAGAGLASDHGSQMLHDGVWVLALPFAFASRSGQARGEVAVARSDRPFQADEAVVFRGLADRARKAATDIVAHELLREQALSDVLTGLGNRRRLALDTPVRLAAASAAQPLAVALFDLDGFKGFNDRFGHAAGDELLERLAARLASAVAPRGDAYRLGGDEFCVLVGAHAGEIDVVIARASAALEERGEGFEVGASHGLVMMPREATDLEGALVLADERMYRRKRRRKREALVA